jgi:hypothetical protein
MSNEIKPGEVSAAITYTFALAFFLFLISGLAGCAKDAYCNLPRPEVEAIAPKIINGEPTLNVRASVLIVIRSNEGEFTCTATRVGENTLVTAAHCVDSEEVYGIDVHSLGTYYGSTEQFEIHGDWSPGKGKRNSKRYEADVAVVWFDFELPSYISIVSVAETPNGCYPGLIALGYGTDENGNIDYVIPREVVVYETYHNRRTIFTTEGSHKGDSGGGLYTETPEGYTIIGVTSYSRDRGHSLPRGATGYTNLYTYGEWVRDRID